MNYFELSAKILIYLDDLLLIKLLAPKKDIHEVDATVFSNKIILKNFFSRTMQNVSLVKYFLKHLVYQAETFHTV